MCAFFVFFFFVHINYSNAELAIVKICWTRNKSKSTKSRLRREEKKNTYKSKIKAIWILLIARGILYEDTEKEEECGPYVNV